MRHLKETPIKTKNPLFSFPSNSQPSELRRELGMRHLTMISIGGSIGTGLFIASGNTIHTAGPGVAIIAYLLMGCIVYLLMTSLGEMAAYMPTSGSFSTYASKFVDPAFGFAIGWNYWFSWTITLAVEISSGAILMKYWFPYSPSILWSALFILFMFGINILSVKHYGEMEFWLSLVKVITIVVFIMLGIAMIFGIFKGNPIGFHNLTIGDAPFHGGFLSILSVFMIAGFSFQGTEMVGIVAGESKAPEKHIPKAVRQIFWRILLFYILTICVIGVIVLYTDPNLVNNDISNITMSPFTLVFEKIGFAFAASIMNAVILVSVLSAGNSGMYVATRMLWVMAKEGKAPNCLKKVNKQGVPINALLMTTAVAIVVFAASLFGEGQAFIWLLNASGLCGFIAWLGIAISHYRFRQAFLHQQKNLNKLPYQAKWYPIGPILAFVICTIIILGQNYSVFIGSHVDWYEVLATYIGLLLFLVFWFGYKIIKKTKVIPLQQVNLEHDDH